MEQRTQGSLPDLRGNMNDKKVLSVLAIVFGGVSFILWLLLNWLSLPFQFLFAPAALVLGIIAAVKKEKLGVVALVLGIVLPIIGSIIASALVAAAAAGA